MPRALAGRRTIDLAVDPAPDLLIEIDSTHSSIDKLSILAILAHLGVPEVWRYESGRLDLRLLEGDRYRASPRSRAFPALTAGALAALLPGSLDVGDIAWIRRARTWVRAQLHAPNAE